ncbi:MAG: hypothetical protein WAV32_10520 [Halobacteriota archaeon]
MGGKFSSAVKCFIKCPGCVISLMRNFGSCDPETLELIKETCPEVEVENLGYYFGLFMGVLFVLLCVMAYIFFYALRVVILYREELFPP